MGRATIGRTKKQRHDPLLQDLASQHGKLRKQANAQTEETEEQDEEYVDAQASRKILQLAREQQEELEEEDQARAQSETMNRFRVADYGLAKDSDEEEMAEEISDFEPEEELEEEVVEIDEEDAAMFEQYFKRSSDFNSANGTYILADKIMAAIREKEMEMKVKAQAAQAGDAGMPSEGVALPERVIRAYTTVGSILKTWTHGKLPKLFKVIPSLNNWEDVLYVTNPEAWSPHVVYEATKLFVSNLSAKGAQKFINMVLLERFRENIETSEDHSLNYHIYRALKKSLYKPAAFFKGFLFPLVETGCNVREATIAASVLARVSVPALHSSAALTYLLRLPFNPATTVFIKVLLEKKYALPYQTVDECVFYFMRFRAVDDGSTGEDATRVLPVVWHKAFLSFAQRYKNDITQDQRDFLLETVRQRGHRDIGPEIRRELLAGKSREFVSDVGNTADLMIDVQ
ncbi:AFL044Wp [Eremothecium gossypii ATCC 10895]|uniref:AFL044Wp n=1 Tax=Eremothecium gossypii (strain ATCC 10895 / CBS 109.51 / FGSC 9923 / NRRL Y-1056) TaxID=284811 RepID=Q754W1_EREGS|nr:AFL044Wp [Eremothecium gossypii ATCC 10895]AAS53328.2 AFL044Wp [Eremothecium gossypii ATCC 10895]AEY97639.1 FAFL044Wp [Eremothecium gossypii FDAG1]